MRSLLEMDTVDEVDEEQWMHVITTKWVRSIKWNSNNTIDRFKARLVARGFSQRVGVDFWDTFAATVHATSIRTFITLCKVKGMLIHQIDVKTAFLNGDIDGEIYIRLPAPYGRSGKVYKLKKGLYGLRQAPRLWSKKLNEILANMNFHPIKSDPCVFVNKDGDAWNYVLVYVDDILIGTKDPHRMKLIKDQLKEKLKITDKGEIGTFLGVDCATSEDGKLLTMSQGRYIDALAERFNMTNACNLYKLPPLETIDLSGDQVDDKLPLRNLVGALLYIANLTRPDITAAVSYLSRYLDRPTKRTWKYAKQVLNYLRSTKDKKLILGNIDNSSISVYADANYAPAGDRKSQSGAVFKFAGSTIGWYSRKQKTVSTSTTEAEYISLAVATNETLWLQHFIEEMGQSVQYPTPIYEDCQPAIAVATNTRNPALAKHIDVRYHALRDYYTKGYIDVKYLNTKLQLADQLTKVRTQAKEADLLLGPQECHGSQNQGEC
jgi:hypothetical protein